MTKEKRIACFFTGGYTEFHAMKLFVRKINSTVQYIQLHPFRQRKNKNDIRNRCRNSIDSEQSGRTGQNLITYVLDFIDKDIFLNEHYDAILIEDDKDERFLNVQSDGISIVDENRWKQEQEKIVEEIKAKLTANQLDIPVIFLWAAPEIEAWFLADWSNSFGEIYKPLLGEERNKFFNVKFRKYVHDKILTNQYVNSLESYGYFDGSYKKLSEELQNALSGTEFWSDFPQDEIYTKIHYSKNLQGAKMLEAIAPDMVAGKCTIFFKQGMLALKEI